MVQLSKKKLDPELYSRIFLLLFDTISNRKSFDQFKKIVHDLFSYPEQIMIAKRIAIFYLLMKKKDFNFIHLTLHVTHQTIYKYDRYLQSNSTIQLFMKRIIQRDKTKTLFYDLLEETFFPRFARGADWKTNNAIHYRRKNIKDSGFAA